MTSLNRLLRNNRSYIVKVSDTIFNLTGSPTGKTLNLDFGANFAGHTVKILATISRTIADSKTKTLNFSNKLQIQSLIS